MKQLILLLSLFAFTLHAEYVQTPFGRVWIGPGLEPKAPVAVVEAPVVFKPAFEKATVNFQLHGQPISVPLNEWYFAKPDTAGWLCRRLMCAFIFAKPFGGEGGIYKASHQELWLAWPDGVQQNAGILASFYVRNPEDKFPGVADYFVNAILRQARNK